MSEQITLVPGRKGPWANESRVESLNSDNFGRLLVAQQGGEYQELALRSMLYAARSGAAAAIPKFDACTNAPTLWNPSDSGKILVPVKIILSAIGLGTQVLTSFVLMGKKDMGDAPGASLPFTAFTNIVPKALRIGGTAVASKGKFANADVAWTAQPDPLLDLGMGQWLSGTAGNGQLFSALEFDLKGMVVMTPGAAICVAADGAASSGTYKTTIIFAEFDSGVLTL